MKVFVGALPFLILATALGSQVQVPHEPVVAKQRQEPSIILHHPADCCSSYTQQIRCAKMKDFFRTSSSCSRPGVIFLTKKERRICADPHVLEVQNCMRSLNNLMMRTGERGGFLEKKWF
ncbi:C-C motif chemokine 15 isoform X1 [Lontra canadensis]|uniref:C-C motif chemokine 15 isoform X1 n=1 Tax=Lontra canadensis TaxID=76717 RepID=UPI0013F357B3|nr:C-C motif chemokine 15 isoform X1 [Lontra canadensis]